MARLNAALPLGDEYTSGGAWPDFAKAEAECAAEGFDIVFSPDSGARLFVELHHDGQNKGEALISLSALEAMPPDVRDWALSQMVGSLLLCALNRSGR